MRRNPFLMGGPYIIPFDCHNAVNDEEEPF